MSISIQNRQKKEKIDVQRLRRSLKRLLRELECGEVDLGVFLVDDDQIRETNRDYLDRDRPTNVISFPMKGGALDDIHPEMLGDIVLSIETAARDARAEIFDIMDEVEFLLIHGLLHLMGYDHENGEARETTMMQQRERELFYMLRHYDLE